MAQTERLMATINDLLSDNTAQEISPQDLRDALASLQGYGSILLAPNGSVDINGVGTDFVLINVYDTISAQSIDVNEAGVVAALSPGFKLTVGSPGTYRISFYASFSSSAVSGLVRARISSRSGSCCVACSRSRRGG